MSQMKQLDIIRQEHRDLRIENAKLKAEVKQLEEHITVVDEFYVPDDRMYWHTRDKPTTGFADARLTTQREVREAEEAAQLDGTCKNGGCNNYLRLDAEGYCSFHQLDCDLSLPQNGYIWINGGGDWGRCKTLEAVKAEMEGNSTLVWELGAQYRTVTKTTWEEVK
jgi:hypothetical protein